MVDTETKIVQEEPSAEPAPENEAAEDIREGAEADIEIDEMRDYSREVEKLLEYCPELKGKQIPDEVIADFTSGADLVQAYREYERKSYIKQYGENIKAARSAAVKRQNAQSAMKAPVRGVYGGGAADNAPADDFLAGFNETW